MTEAPCNFDKRRSAGVPIVSPAVFNSMDRELIREVIIASAHDRPNTCLEPTSLRVKKTLANPEPSTWLDPEDQVCSAEVRFWVVTRPRTVDGSGRVRAEPT
jgi:hypothetical protein